MTLSFLHGQKNKRKQKNCFQCALLSQVSETNFGWLQAQTQQQTEMSHHKRNIESAKANLLRNHTLRKDEGWSASDSHTRGKSSYGPLSTGASL